MSSHFAQRLGIGAITFLLASSAFASKPELGGKRLADRIISATDQQRGSMDPKAIEMALRRHGAKRAALRADFVSKHTSTYSKELPATPIRSQASSGRCWIFTALNMIERDYALRAGNSVKLSRAWINAKNLQSTAYELIQTGASASSLTAVSNSDIGEGGHFAYALNIIEKYGAVPERVMRDFHDSKNSGTAVKLIEIIVVDAQERLKQTGKNTPEALAIVKQARADIDRTIARVFTGKEKLPDTFIHEGKTYTPKTFADEQLLVKPAHYVTLQDQRSTREGWSMAGSGIHRFTAYNTGSIEVMKEAVRAAIDQGKKVYVSAPVGPASAPYMTTNDAAPGAPATPGVMSIVAHDYASLGLAHPPLDRTTVQRNGVHPTNHAMTITGYDLGSDGKVIKWKVENSWGEKAADRGIQHMYDDFFTTFVGVVTVPRTAIAPSMAAKMNAEAKVLLELQAMKDPT